MASGQGSDIRKLGQVWTPEDIANAMAMWAARPGRPCVDPSCGSGRLLDAAARWTQVIGVDVEPNFLKSHHDIHLGDYMSAETRALLPEDCDFTVNPPYVRHHAMSPKRKATLRAETSAQGLRLRGTVGLHAFFVFRVVMSMLPGSRASLLLPTDLFEGESASELLAWTATKVRLAAVACTLPETDLFEGLDARGLLLFLEAPLPETISSPSDVPWAAIGPVERPHLTEWVRCGFRHPAVPTIMREIACVTATPSRSECTRTDVPRLGDIARVSRGLVAVDASWALLTSAGLRDAGLPQEAFRRIIRRAGDLPRGAELTETALDAMDARGIPTWMFSPSPEHATHPAVAAMLIRGIAMGMPKRPSAVSRNPWWKPERRETPPWLFGYFGPVGPHRFVHNLSDAAPLTGHLCIYPRPGCEAELDAALSNPRTCLGIPLVGKCHGTAYKVEPRALERLPLP